MFSHRFNPKKHQEDRRKNRPITTVMPSYCHINPSRVEATHWAQAKERMNASN